MERKSLSPVKNQEEVQERLSSLPEFSQSVYRTLHSSLYAEAFFSDVQVDDLAKALNCSVFSINSSLGHLQDAGLVYSEEYDGNRKKRIFLHTYEHDNFQVL